MFSYFKRFRRFALRTQVFAGAGAVIVLVIGGYFISGGSKGQVRDVYTVKKGDVREEINVTGKVKSAQNVDLAFEKSGRVVRVATEVGNTVQVGSLLVELDHADLSASLLQAQAVVRAREAALAALERGARPEEIQIAESKVESAKQSLGDAQKNAINYIQDAYTKFDNAIGGQIDQFYLNPKTQNPQFPFANFQVKSDAESGRVRVEGVLTTWKSLVTSENIAKDFSGAFTKARENLGVVRDLLDIVSTAINALMPNGSMSQTTINVYRTDVSSARTAINSAFTNLASAEEKLTAAQSALNVAQRELNLTRAGSSAEDIDSARAQLEEAQANVKNIQAQISKTILVSPIAGVVTHQDTKVGEIVGPNINVVSLASASQFQIEAFVPEADIAKIQRGNSGHITLDAYGSDVVFDANVVQIDPAETVIDGVSTYKVTIQFSKNDDRVKSGMTANVDIDGALHQNVLVVPQRAITSKNGDKIVKRVDGQNTIDQKVEIGLRDSKGMAEIRSGVKESDVILVSPGAN